MNKDCIVVMLPTDKPVCNGLQIFSYKDNKKLIIPITGAEARKIYNQGCVPQHLYILSTDGIKEGDWWVDLALSDTPFYTIRNCKLSNIKRIDENCRKIIATTDTSLLKEWKEFDYLIDEGFLAGKYNLPSIPQSFIELFIKKYNEGNSITKVKVEGGYSGGFPVPGVIDIGFKPYLNGNEIIIHIQQETFTKKDMENAFDCCPQNTTFKEWFNSKY